MEARGEKINISSCPSKEIYSGSEEEDGEDDDAWIGKIRVCGNSRMKRSRYVGALWASM